ncbi:MBL fold metallo-hydrolase [Filimonas zeae]|uniref:MBL fold metallo-hydrolase n=1 Tax=Filimonas zeae TaxID=1737353 RepID=A0A917MU85_9BACT|nr:MBL fold metallo-hydrolase [Filimonas zeae]
MALSDGTFTADVHSILKEADSTEVSRLLHSAFLNDTTETSINAYLINTGTRVLLVDAGAGSNLGSGCGKLLQHLRDAGYNAADITDILITHIHIDHVSGLSDTSGRTFPNATLHIHQKDLTFWQQHATPRADDTWGIRLNRPGYQAVIPYLTAGRVHSFDSTTELFPGISAVAYNGHTPGHTIYTLRDGEEKMAFWGDLIHVAAVQFSNPAITVAYDSDKTLAVTRRQQAYSDAAQNGYLVAASHISFPGVGRVSRSDNRYTWYPVNYSIYGKN